MLNDLLGPEPDKPMQTTLVVPLFQYKGDHKKTNKLVNFIAYNFISAKIRLLIFSTKIQLWNVWKVTSMY